MLLQSQPCDFSDAQTVPKTSCALQLDPSDVSFLPLLFQMGTLFLKKNTVSFPSRKLFDPMIQPKEERK